jgi:predicted lysophospholipase L1 biosynthesis ABC-type transport system permease subunit
MRANVGTLDRLIRLVVGLALVVVPFAIAAPELAAPAARYGMIAVGAVLVLTALFRFCPLYRLAGLRTCRA